MSGYRRMKEYIIFECKNCRAKYIAEVPKAFRPYEIAHMACPCCGAEFMSFSFKLEEEIKHVLQRFN